MSPVELPSPVPSAESTFASVGWFSIWANKVWRVCDWLLLAFPMTPEVLELMLEMLIALPFLSGNRRDPKP